MNNSSLSGPERCPTERRVAKKPTPRVSRASGSGKWPGILTTVNTLFPLPLLSLRLELALWALERRFSISADPLGGRESICALDLALGGGGGGGKGGCYAQPRTTPPSHQAPPTHRRLHALAVLFHLHTALVPVGVAVPLRAPALCPCPLALTLVLPAPPVALALAPCPTPRLHRSSTAPSVPPSYLLSGCTSSALTTVNDRAYLIKHGR
ncbi:unnamed protein product [Cyclocybe aegerita]|uniref:Uncharacterized protein n=1 Tax=Cyclocybe aegerita TaxID=1973307 RepID=A0A8S0VXS9_CYCAE|nr:unnamed protein product [Cyclocybe aegerita]